MFKVFTKNDLRSIVLSAVIILLFNSVNVYGYSISVAGGIYPGKIPIIYRVYYAFSDLTKQEIGTAAAEWNKYSPAGNLLQLSTSDIIFDNLRQNDGINSMIKYYIESDEQAVNYQTYMTVNNVNYLTESDIVFNTKYPFANSVAPNYYYVGDTVTHELGHTVGLGDLYGSGDVDKTMYGIGYTNTDKRCTLTQDDINGLVYIYTHNLHAN